MCIVILLLLISVELVFVEKYIGIADTALLRENSSFQQEPLHFLTYDLNEDSSGNFFLNSVYINDKFYKYVYKK